MSEAPATQTGIRLMRMSEVLSLTGIKSRSTIYELQAGGDFPQAVRLTGKAIGFVESEIHAWIRSRVEARPAPETAPPTRPRARLRHRTITTTRPSTGHPAASQSGATPPPTTTSTASTTAPARRRGPARTAAQRQQGPGSK